MSKFLIRHKAGFLHTFLTFLPRQLSYLESDRTIFCLALHYYWMQTAEKKKLSPWKIIWLISSHLYLFANKQREQPNKYKSLVFLLTFITKNALDQDVNEYFHKQIKTSRKKIRKQLLKNLLIYTAYWNFLEISRSRPCAFYMMSSHRRKPLDCACFWSYIHQILALRLMG